MRILIKSEKGLVTFKENNYLDILPSGSDFVIFMQSEEFGSVTIALGTYTTEEKAKEALKTIVDKINLAIDGGNVIVIIEDY